MRDPSWYEGTSGFLRWWPKALVVIAVGLLVVGWPRSIQWATLLLVVAVMHSQLLPWRFVVAGDGLALTFPFGRRVFIPKEATTIRLEHMGAIALVGRHRRIGYPLTDQVLYVPGKGAGMRQAFAWHRYHLAD
jgi:hypothetical protein